MKDLLMKLIDNEPITDKDIAEQLFEICDREHATCNDECPVYEHNESKIPLNEAKNNCRCFKQGSAMLQFIRERRQ